MTDHHTPTRNFQGKISTSPQGGGGPNIISVQRAKILRKNHTEAERIFWNAVRAKRLDGYKFRRQHPMGEYIVDFICLEKKLIIEMDGGQHADGDQKKHDERRDAWLRSRGYSVLRIWNMEIENNLTGVLEAVCETLRMSEHPPPP